MDTLWDGDAEDGWVPDAAMYPWMTVERDDETYLFGFALRHPVTGGLARTLSTAITKLDVNARRAVTQSGRKYALGERLAAPVDLPTVESRVAYALLVMPLLGMNPAEALGDKTDVQASQWVTTQKMARHLYIPPPSWDDAAVSAFMDRNGSRYLRLMPRRRGE